MKSSQDEPRARSACAEASFRAQLERIRAMSVEERILAALSLSRKFAWIQPAPRQNR